MKLAKVLLAVAVAVAALYGFIRFFVAQLGVAQSRELAGIVLTPPPGFAVDDLGSTDRPAAARALAALLLRRAGEPRLGVHFRTGGYELLWLVDRSAAAAPSLLERSAGPGGTRLETTWHGGLERRLEWAGEHGDFEVPGLAPGERRNLYH